MKQSIRAGIAAAVAMMLLILDSQTAYAGAKEGVMLCISTVIPSLFPFMVLSALITSGLSGNRISIFRPLGKLCRIPMGAESILITGWIAGYPIGAKCVAQAWKSGQLSKQDAQRMLGFCSNAGPAFLFGILSVKFPSPVYPLTLWLILLLSSIVTGMLLPRNQSTTPAVLGKSCISLPQALDQSVKAIANVCGWVVLFRVILAIGERWFLWLFPVEFQTVFQGILELTNGCCDLEQISSIHTRFVAAAGLLSFGGICVVLQTASVIHGLGISSYLSGKFLQTVISIIMAEIVSVFLCPSSIRNMMLSLLPVVLLLWVSFLIIFRKNSKNKGRNSEILPV